MKLIDRLKAWIIAALKPDFADNLVMANTAALAAPMPLQTKQGATAPAPRRQKAPYFSWNRLGSGVAISSHPFYLIVRDGADVLTVIHESRPRPKCGDHVVWRETEDGAKALVAFAPQEIDEEYPLFFEQPSLFGHQIVTKEFRTYQGIGITPQLAAANAHANMLAGDTTPYVSAAMVAS